MSLFDVMDRISFINQVFIVIVKLKALQSSQGTFEYNINIKMYHLIYEVLLIFFFFRQKNP